MERILPMIDAKSILGTAMTATAGWVDWAEPIVTMTVTIVVGGATLWYTIERALKLRKERKNK